MLAAVVRKHFLRVYARQQRPGASRFFYEPYHEALSQTVALVTFPLIAVIWSAVMLLPASAIAASEREVMYLRLAVVAVAIIVAFLIVRSIVGQYRASAPVTEEFDSTRDRLIV